MRSFLEPAYLFSLHNRVPKFSFGMTRVNSMILLKQKELFCSLKNLKTVNVCLLFVIVTTKIDVRTTFDNTENRWFLTRKIKIKKILNCLIQWEKVGKKSAVVHIYESHHTKGETWNYPMKATAPTFQNRPHPPPHPPLIRKNNYVHELCSKNKLTIIRWKSSIDCITAKKI